MFGTIIYMIMITIVSVIFVILGIFQYNSKTPVSINTGEKPPEAGELTDVTLWNHGHGRNLIIYAIAFFITSTVFIIILEKTDAAAIEIPLYVIANGLEIFWVITQDKKMKRELIKNYSPCL